LSPCEPFSGMVFSKESTSGCSTLSGTTCTPSTTFLPFLMTAASTAGPLITRHDSPSGARYRFHGGGLRGWLMDNGVGFNV